MDMTQSILPRNAQALERALEQVAAERLQTLWDAATQIGDLWNPWACPVEFLPWLAHSFSVDVWSSAWGEQAQRQAIADSELVHRIKGTPESLTTALNALSATLEYTDWRESNSAPYSAQLIAFVRDNVTSSGNTILTPELQSELWRIVERTQQASVDVSFAVGAEHRANTSATAAATHAEIAVADANTVMLGHQYTPRVSHVYSAASTATISHSLAATKSQSHTAATATTAAIATGLTIRQTEGVTHG